MESTHRYIYFTNSNFPSIPMSVDCTESDSDSVRHMSPLEIPSFDFYSFISAHNTPLTTSTPPPLLENP